MLTLLLLVACPPIDDKDTDTTGDAPDAVCTEPVEPECVDEMILDLSLHGDATSDGAVTTIADGDDFVTTVDATAGGYQQASQNPWVYVRFAADGASRVDIDDETALEDMSWHLSLRRFIVRINSGDSGPSCVGAAALLGYAYADVAEVPDGVSYRPDEYYTDDCTLINDSSGLEGSPQAAMGAWWEYPGCVATTGTPFLIQLDDGSVLKLVVESYYADDGQAECNENGMTSAESAIYTLRWRWM